MDKTSIRNKMKIKLNAMDKITYEHKSYQIAKQLFHTNEWKNAAVIGITVSRFPEVDTWQVIRKGWAEGKAMVIPKCYPSTKNMKFFQIHEFNQMERVYYGLFEPKENHATEVKNSDIDLLIVPGLAFTTEGYRIGFGGGYFDRFLMHFQGANLSLAFTEQIKEELPIEQYDLPITQIITEQGFIDCKKNV